MADVVDMHGQSWLDQELTTNRRANIIGSLLEFISARADWVEYQRLFDLIMCEHELPEETVGPEILDAVFLLVHSGLLTCNTFDDGSGVLTHSADTKLRRAHCVSIYVQGLINSP